MLQTNFCSIPPFTSQDETTSSFAWEIQRRARLPKFAPSTWVKLLNPPTAFSFDEAWLLCQYADDHWLAWIPDYGEILLKTDEICEVS
ncbi:hypothetical protein C7B65_09055 [Phormidesmis priestleyi ULC007]|uniref:Uncharacterized protein n=1 Tax=Phormidesmis priestleyi ULC007 TaxID=1920490 RepID=A0A2T1DI84_9CYAN|nr:hypothetical protein [Phormidesmis priestleyi]PSB20187.1 hypothetical protein C7B65_09055 [Phormidesmis priestleyi ULC007]